MPLIVRSEPDVFRLWPITDIYVNPHNAMGIAGAGLSEKIKLRYPLMHAEYRTFTQEQQRHVGDVMSYQPTADEAPGETKAPLILNVVTRHHWVDEAPVEDIEQALSAVAEFLSQPQYRYHTVTMPMFAPKPGQTPFAECLPLMRKHLDHLPNTIHLSVGPKSLDYKVPQYLVIFGPRAVRDHIRVQHVVERGLAAWGAKWSDFDAVISGGARGVDMIACGDGDPRSIHTAQCLAKKYHPAPPVVCAADWDRYGKSAGYIRNATMMDIGTHFIGVILDDEQRSHGTFAMRDMVTRHISSTAADLIPKVLYTEVLSATDGFRYDTKKE